MAAPLIALALAPLVGGAMSLVGGAMSMSGGVVHAASTMAGIAADAAGGVMGAVGGLAGGGQSGQVQSKAGDSYATDSPQGKMIVQAQKDREKKSKEGASKGTALAKVKPTIDLGIMDEGPSSLLPTGKESQTTLLGQILGSIRGLYAPINSIAAAVMSPPMPAPPEPEDLITKAQQKKGGDKGDGIVKRTFSALGTKLKDLSGSLASAGKFLLKGLLLGGAFLLFKKYEKNITSMVASVFETLEGWYTSMKDPDSIWNNMGSLVTDSILPFIEKMVHKVMEMFVSMWNTMAEGNWWLPKLNWDDDYSPPDAATTAASSSALTTHASGVSGDLGTVKGHSSIIWDPLHELEFESMGGDADQQVKTQQLVLKRLSDMYNWVVNSDGRIQWTDIGDGFTIGEGINSLEGNIPIADIMASKPIINGKISTEADLASWTPAIPAGVSDATQFRANQAMMTQAKQMSLSGLSTRLNNWSTYGNLLQGQTWSDKFEAAKQANKVLLPVQTSDSGNGQAIVVASNDNRDIKTFTGDIVNKGLGVHHTDTTASAYREFVLA